MVAQDDHHRKLNSIGETHWSKSKALFKVFGSAENKEKSMYIVVISALEMIERNKFWGTSKGQVVQRRFTEVLDNTNCSHILT